MKEILMVMDEDPVYSKKFCNQANKLLGKKYNFLTFSNLKLMKKYAEENPVEGLVVSESFADNIDDIKAKSIYFLNEKDKKTRQEGKRNYIYKLQNVKNVLEVIDKDIDKKNLKSKSKTGEACKLFLYYSPTYIKNKLEIVKRISKVISKKKKVLIIDLDEFENYKGSVGLSNIIYDYKENSLTEEKLRREIVTEKDQEIIKSVTYPEDFNVVTNIDIANIVNEITKLGYDFIFINADASYVKCQYILNDADSVVVMRDKESSKVDKLKAYLKNENQLDIKKITVFDLAKLDKAYLAAFCKQCFLEKNDD